MVSLVSAWLRLALIMQDDDAEQASATRGFAGVDTACPELVQCHIHYTLGWRVKVQNNSSHGGTTQQSSRIRMQPTEELPLDVINAEMHSRTREGRGSDKCGSIVMLTWSVARNECNPLWRGRKS